MGDCRLTFINENGEQHILLDIGPTWPERNEPEDSDPGSIINGGSGWPTLKK